MAVNFQYMHVLTLLLTVSAISS